MNDRILITCIFALALSACAKKDEQPVADTNATTTPAEAPMPDTAGAAAQNDESFIQTAAEGGMAEVEAGQLAQTKGKSGDVKSFGEMMVKDHSKANEKLKAIAANNGVTLPAQLNADHEAMKATLSGLSGKDFDKEYIRGQIKDHEATLALLQTEISSGGNEEAKGFANEILPTVQAHLDKIKEIAAKAGVDAG